MEIRVTSKAPSLLSFLLYKKRSLLGASLSDMTNIATEVPSTFSFQLLFELWSQFGDLLFNESVELYVIAGCVCSSWEFSSRLLVVFLFREAEHSRIANHVASSVFVGFWSRTCALTCFLSPNR